MKFYSSLLAAVLGLTSLNFSGCKSFPFSNKERLVKIYEGDILGEKIIYYERDYDRIGYGKIEIYDEGNSIKEVMIDGYDPVAGDGKVDYFYEKKEEGFVICTLNYVIDQYGSVIRGKGHISSNVLEFGRKRLNDATIKYNSLLFKIKEEKIKQLTNFNMK